MTFDMIKRNYDRKLWNETMVAVAVVKGVITEDQYQEIIGKVYPSSSPQNLRT